ncbi:MAG: acyltransferase [Bacteroidaceae bacterium]|nr:acyltransferase [Bacteroidaceae bacterium]
MIDTLTSLRLIFALMVFASHLCMINEGAFSGHILKEGYVGVSFFFILSGFIIAHNYTERLLNSNCSKKDFWVARFARIYPLHLLTLVVAIFIGGTFIATQPLSWAHLFTSATLTNAYIPRSDFFFALNSPAWSLCCEQLFYILFPMALPLARSPKKLAIIAATAVIAVVIGGQFTPEQYIKGIWYTNPITRLPDFVVGVLLWHAYKKIKDIDISYRTANIAEFSAILLFAIFYLYAGDIPKIYRYSFYYWLPITAIIITFSLQKGALSHLLKAKIFIKGGEISYGIYLIQIIIINAISPVVGHLHPAAGAIIALVAITATSYLSYNYFEKPINRFIKETYRNRCKSK